SLRLWSALFTAASRCAACNEQHECRQWRDNEKPGPDFVGDSAAPICKLRSLPLPARCIAKRQQLGALAVDRRHNASTLNDQFDGITQCNFVAFAIRIEIAVTNW